MEKPQSGLPRIKLINHSNVAKQNGLFFYFCSSLLTQLIYITVNKATFIIIEIKSP